ncbi:MAG TPA: response regulator [Anaerolineales bacterium]|nr:response regulator [Anaerolineales bacterium]
MVLLIDDEVQIRRFLRISLETNGYRVHESARGDDGLAEAARLRPDLIVLDLGLPGLEGLEVLRRLREWTRVPVIVLSVRASEDEKIALLDAGADDYLTKPFGVGELLARLRAAARHNAPVNESPVIEVGALKVDFEKRRVWNADAPVALSNTEYALLRLFVQNAGKVLTHNQILRDVWGPGYSEELHYLRVYVANLRKKIEKDPANPVLHVTEPGVGYRFAAS